MAVELVFISTASGSRDAFDVYCHFLVAVEVAVEMAVDFQSGSRKVNNHQNFVSLPGPRFQEPVRPGLIDFGPWMPGKSCVLKLRTGWIRNRLFFGD